jgi:hypothetical protein
MSVTLVVSKTITGAEVSDTLAGGSSGLDFGQVVNGSYAPVISQVGNTGRQDLFLSHNATVDPITSVKFYTAQYSGTYGGANTAAADFTQLGTYGSTNSGADKNNVDGNSRGLHIDMDWQVADANQFDPTREAGGQKRIFGKSYTGLDGLSLANAFTMHADAASYWNGSSEVDASAPVTGKVGKSSDTVLGNRGHIRARWYLHSGETNGGILQHDFVVAFSYTA